ncbi:hypothetical protein MATL_G00074250 [Megalops atlanticus]|uniref:Uncharacterized protein n=1 Tax=Megalops atlanticus TaxID=7932 RepID=A0A9D3TC91_MEGAT|nr:hypothetical protein MATL_G00074250 [Megalops atlanticus]
MEDTPDNYDDVITVDQSPGSVAGELLKGDATEYYDDVITMGESADPVSVERLLATEVPPDPEGTEYDDVGEEPLEGGGAF